MNIIFSFFFLLFGIKVGRSMWGDAPLPSISLHCPPLPSIALYCRAVTDCGAKCNCYRGSSHVRNFSLNQIRLLVFGEGRPALQTHILPERFGSAIRWFCPLWFTCTLLRWFVKYTQKFAIIITLCLPRLLLLSDFLTCQHV